MKNLLDWLSISFDNYSYNELFKDKDVAIISSVDGKGNNAKNAFDLLGAQLSNDGFKRPIFYYPVERGYERELKKRITYFSKLRNKFQNNGN